MLLSHVAVHRPARRVEREARGRVSLQPRGTLRTDAATPAPSPKRRHARIYVYRFQKTYALWLCLLLFIYSVVIFGLEFEAPYVLPALKLIAPLPLEERALAAQQFLAFGQTLWPALAVLIVAAAVFSLHLTHRLAGPLHRLHQSARELAQGNLTLRVRLRRGDELHELAHVANTALVNLDQAFGDIRAHGAHSQTAVGRVVEALRAQPGANPEYLADWEGALKESEQLEAVLQRFRFAERLSGPGGLDGHASSRAEPTRNNPDRVAHCVGHRGDSELSRDSRLSELRRTCQDGRGQYSRARRGEPFGRLLCRHRRLLG